MESRTDKVQKICDDVGLDIQVEGRVAMVMKKTKMMMVIERLEMKMKTKMMVMEKLGKNVKMIVVMKR